MKTYRGHQILDGSNVMVWVKDEKGEEHPVPYPCSCGEPSCYDGTGLLPKKYQWLCSVCYQHEFWDSYQQTRMAKITEALLGAQASSQASFSTGWTDFRGIYGSGP